MNRWQGDGQAEPGPTEDPAFRGLVLGTEAEAAAPLEFSVYVQPGRYLQLDDVVAVESRLPDEQRVMIYGVVDELAARHEGVQLISDVSLVREGLLPAEPVVAAHVSVTRVEPEIYVPPMPGSSVRLASGETRARALFFDEMDLRFPLGLPRGDLATVEPVWGNVEFLNGEKGAHVNISGISGVATKTSYATYLLYALFEGQRLPLAQNARALVFNVKGEDLLFLDKPNRQLDRDPELGAQYERLGLPAGPFRSVSFYAPLRAGSHGPLPDTGSRAEDVVGFYWTLGEFCRRGYLRLMFLDQDTEQTQVATLVDTVSARLRDVSDELDRLGGFDDLVERIEDHLSVDSEPGVASWAGVGQAAASLGTIRAFMRRLRAAARHVGPLVRGQGFADPEKHRIALKRQVTVVDLHKLHDRAQRFVVGVLLEELLAEREQTSVAAGAPPLFIVVDELNKYAPREGTSPIKETLLDIAERGRSLGLILIGAQQTASEVEQRIVANASFRVVGRLDAAEAQRPEYRFLGTAWRQRATLLAPGSMVVHQPEIPVPLLARFPHPAWATRKSEVQIAPPGMAGDGRRDVMARFSDSPPLD